MSARDLRTRLTRASIWPRRGWACCVRWATWKTGCTNCTQNSRRTTEDRQRTPQNRQNVRMKGMTMPLKTLLLNPPSFKNFDGGASSRWPATREIESYWYPVWLTYPAGLLEGSRVLDASPHHVSPEETIKICKDYEPASIMAVARRSASISLASDWPARASKAGRFRRSFGIRPASGNFSTAQNVNTLSLGPSM